MTTLTSRSHHASSDILDLSYHEGRRSTKKHPKSFNQLLSLIRRNAITELRLGWWDCDWIGASKWAAMSLERALRQNTSITHISIGNRSLTGRSTGMLASKSLSRRKEVLIFVLEAIVSHLKRQVTHFQLVLDDWLPETFLLNMLQQLGRLVVLDLRSVQLLHLDAKTDCYCCDSKKDTQKWRDPWALCDHNIVSRVLIHCKFEHLRSLALVDCGITDRTAMMLADYLHIRGGIARLNVSGNRLIGPRGWGILIQAPVIQKFDACICNLTCCDALAIASSMIKRPWPLGELLLRGNYRIDTPGFLALTSSACCDKLLALDLSYCDIGDNKALKIVKNLQRLQSTALLQQISLQGSLVSGLDVSSELSRLLQGNTSLRIVRLNDPYNPRVFCSTQLEGLLTGLSQNYNVEEMYLDSNQFPEEVRILKDMDFFMRLNRAGRRVLRAPVASANQQSSTPLEQGKELDLNEDWLKVLERAGDDLDVLFWMVKESADRFGPKQPLTQRVVAS